LLRAELLRVLWEAEEIIARREKGDHLNRRPRSSHDIHQLEEEIVRLSTEKGENGGEIGGRRKRERCDKVLR